MRVRTLFLTALLLLPFSVPGFAQYPGPGRYGPPYPGGPPAPRPAAARTLWAYGPGDQFQFRQMTDGRWVQYAADGRFYFDEVNRTPDYVELFDPTRKISARLYDDSLWTRPQGFDRFAYSLGGHWLY